jgi:AcrR family transcriptional regulator
MSDEKRPYQKRRRAQLEDDTRRQITESAVELHGTVGPSRTTVSAVAEHAGVRRSTVYRHFPDEPALFAACSAHWGAANPVPDLGRWAAIEDPDERLRRSLEELYAYYRRTQGMLDNLLRQRTKAAVGHAVAFTTWRSLASEQELDDRQAADLMCRLVAAARPGPSN